MIQVGIFTGYFPYALEETATKIRKHGFNTVQLDMSFKDMDLETSKISKAKCKKIRDTFRAHNLPVCAVSGYTNIVHPDPAARAQKLKHLKTLIRNARDLGTPYVISETGTFDTESDWVHHPKNKTEEGYETCRDVIADLVKEAYDHGAVFLLETYVNNVVGSVGETLRLFADIDSPSLGLLMDPTNYFEDHNIDSMDQVLNQQGRHALQGRRLGEACRHRRLGGPHLPRRRRHRAAGARPGIAQLRPLSRAAGGQAPQHPDRHRASRGARRAARQGLRRPEA